MTLAICTGFWKKDYEYSGDVEAFTEFRKKYREYDFHNLIDTTKPAVLLWDNCLYVTGLQTKRKDVANRTIRYSFFLENEIASSLFDGLKAELRKEGIINLGDELDTLLEINEESHALPEKLPSEEKFIGILRKFCSKESLCGELRIWTDFQPLPDEPDEKEKLFKEKKKTFKKIKVFINGLKVPEGFMIEVKDFDPFEKKTLIQTLEKILSKKYLRVVIVLALLLLTALFYTITKSSDQKAPPNDPQQKINESVKREEAAKNLTEEKTDEPIKKEEATENPTEEKKE